MVLADKILEGMTDRKIGTASAVKACNAFVGGRDICRPKVLCIIGSLSFIYLLQ